MASDGSVPPVNFRKRFDKPPQQQKQKKKLPQSHRNATESNEEDSKPRPVDPENPPTIDLTV